MRQSDPRHLELTEWVEVALTSDVPEGRARLFTLGERRIAVYHTASGFFATDNTCPHRGGPLAEGDLIGDEIVCPWHLWSFNVQTGINPGNPELIVQAHEVRIEGDKILVRLADTPAHESETAPQA